MRPYQDRKFHVSPQLIEMFALRASGFTIERLAVRFNRATSTVRHHLRVHQIAPLYVEVWHPKGVTRTHQTVTLREEPINQGMNYTEYIKRLKERHAHR